MDSTLRQKLIDLFKETGPAHHQAYHDTNGEDPEWPLWYARYMQTRLSDLLQMPVTQSKLVQLLVSAAEDQERNAPKADWTEYYADFLLRLLKAPNDRSGQISPQYADRIDQ